MSNKAYLEILKGSFPELAAYHSEVRVVNEKQVLYRVEEVEDQLLTSMIALNKYGALRKSAKRMANTIVEVKTRRS